MDLRHSILQTRSYASFFNFSLFPEEVHHWLISSKTNSFSDILPQVGSKLSLKKKKQRRLLTFHSLNKIKIAKKLAQIIKFLPEVQLLALTGSVAANNSKLDDDIDLFIITSPHTLWITRPFFLFLVSLFFRLRHPLENPSQTKDAFCPNLWLDFNFLSMPVSKRNLYTAHEILQMVPLVDKNHTYNQFLLQNSWIKKYLANAYHAKTKEQNTVLNDSLLSAQAITTVKSVFLIPLNYLFYLSQLIYMLPKKTSESVCLHAAFLHTRNYSEKLFRHVNPS